MDLERFTHIVERRITEWLQAQEKTAPNHEAKILLERMRTLISRGGKRIRPQLLYMTYVAYGGNAKESEALINLGVALELHHQFLLIHDDIMDSDTVRYDGPNITGYYRQDNLSQENLPETMALLAGDLLFSFSNEVIIKDKKLTDKEKIALLMLLHDTNIGVGYGQQLDILSTNDIVNFTEEKLIVTHRLKAALYTTQLPMLSAATLLGLNPDEKKKIHRFTEPFGIFFQLIDDYSDYFNNDSAFNNRPKYRDIKQGKVTYPFYIALKLAKPEEAKYIKRCFGNKELTGTSIKKVVAILEKCGAKKASQVFAETYFMQAKSALADLAIDVTAQRIFTALIEQYRIS
jgi:geranylgeranyl pyrophosphate synthase